MACVITLSVMSKSNINEYGIDWFAASENDTIARNDISNFVTSELVTPMKTCYAEAHPHVFMTKCYSDLYFVLDEKNEWGGKLGKIRKGQTVSGMIEFVDCGQKEFVCNIKVNYTDKMIEVKGSFFEEWTPGKDFLKNWCTKVSQSAE